MYKIHWHSLLIIFILTSCPNPSVEPKSFDIQGHRGCRGLFPENSLPGFIHAVTLGVTTLEMDVVVSKDSLLVVSHEPYISNILCSYRGVNSFEKYDKDSFNIFQLTYIKIKEFDCGSLIHPDYPEQKKIKVYKPLLSEVIDSVENYIKNKGLDKVFYNIEIKSSPEGDHIFHPDPKAFAKILLKELEKKNMISRCIIQSFDTRSLIEIHSQNKKVKTALLVEYQTDFKEEVKKLGFIPDFYSPYYMLVTREMRNYLQTNEIKLVPWTVNDTNEMKMLITLGVDGIITDYPDRLIKLQSSFSKKR